jgi:ribose 5-phosphate isomerase RpiB
MKTITTLQTFELTTTIINLLKQTYNDIEDLDIYIETFDNSFFLTISHMKLKVANETYLAHWKTTIKEHLESKNIKFNIPSDNAKKFNEVIFSIYF